MERKRKLPARGAARGDPAAKRRSVATPSTDRSLTPVPGAGAAEGDDESTPAPAAPTPTQAPPPSQPLPTSVQSSKPLPTVEEPQAEEISMRDYQSLQESGVLAESLLRSRKMWMDGLFEKYWTKPSRRKGVAEEPGNPGKDTMTKLGAVVIKIEPHLFDATMFSVKDPTPNTNSDPTPASDSTPTPASTSTLTATSTSNPLQQRLPATTHAAAVFRPIMQYGPPNGVMPPLPEKKEAKTVTTTAMATATPTPTATPPSTPAAVGREPRAPSQPATTETILKKEAPQPRPSTSSTSPLSDGNSRRNSNSDSTGNSGGGGGNGVNNALGEKAGNSGNSGNSTVPEGQSATSRSTRAPSMAESQAGTNGIVQTESVPSVPPQQYRHPHPSPHPNPHQQYGHAAAAAALHPPVHPVPAAHNRHYPPATATATATPMPTATAAAAAPAAPAGPALVALPPGVQPRPPLAVPGAHRPQSPVIPKSGDPIILVLAERAATDESLREVMRKVAAGIAPPEELQKFQRIIEQISLEQERRRNGPPGPLPGELFVNGKTVSHLASEARAILEIVLASNPSQRGADLKPPRGADPLILALVRQALDEPRTREMVNRIADNKPGFTDGTDLKAVLDRLHSLVSNAAAATASTAAVTAASAVTAAASASPFAPQSQTEPQQQQNTNGRIGGGEKAEEPGTPSQQQQQQQSGANTSQTALRSKGPPPAAPKPDISAIVFEFAGGSGDRYLFPRFSVLQYEPDGQQVIASFLMVRRGSTCEVGGDPALDYWEPVTIRITGRPVEHLRRVVGPEDEVRRYMDDVKRHTTRAEFVLLAMRLPRDSHQQLQLQLQRDEAVEDPATGRSTPRTDALTPQPLRPLRESPSSGVLWAARASSSRGEAGGGSARETLMHEGEDRGQVRYQKFIGSVAKQEEAEAA